MKKLAILLFLISFKLFSQSTIAFAHAKPWMNTDNAQIYNAVFLAGNTTYTGTPSSISYTSSLPFSNTDLLQIYNSIRILGAVTATTVNGWSLLGNTTTSLNFIGTINNQPFTIKTNNAQVAQFTAAGDYKFPGNFNDAFNVNSINPYQRELFDNSGNISVDYANRQLLDNVGNTIIDWHTTNVATVTNSLLVKGSSTLTGAVTGTNGTFSGNFAVTGTLFAANSQINTIYPTTVGSFLNIQTRPGSTRDIIFSSITNTVGASISGETARFTSFGIFGVGTLGSETTNTLISIQANRAILTPTLYGSVAATGTLNIISTTSATKGVINIGTSTGTVNINSTNFNAVNVNSRITTRSFSITSSATPTINTDLFIALSITSLSVNITSFTTNLSGAPMDFDQFVMRIIDDGTPRLLSFGSKFEDGGATLPTTTVASTKMTIGFIYDFIDGKWRCESVN